MSDFMIKYVKEEIKKVSEDAVKSGNKFPGCLGQDVGSFEKEDLLMLLNVLYYQLQLVKNELYKIDKL